VMQNILNDLCHVTNRAPMQWSDRQFAGFTTGDSAWTEVSNDYHSVNVEVVCYCHLTTARVGSERKLDSPCMLFISCPKVEIYSGRELCCG